LRALPLEGGFTMIETLIAAFVLAVGIGGLFGMLSISVKATGSSRAREGATNLAQEILEDARTIPYAQLSPTDIVSELQTMNGLANTSGTSTWQITRRGYTYTITASECSIDDPKDKFGKHDSTFCADSNKEGTEAEDSQPADMKRITVDVTWPARGRSPRVHEVETLTAAGQTVGLTASGLKLLSPSVEQPTAPVISSATITELEFVVTTTASAAAVEWTLEGARQSPAPVKKTESTTEWVFKWAIPTSTVSDGTYQVGAQAVDATGVYGPPVSISVTLARIVPAAPKGIEGGFNTITVGGKSEEVAEFQWLANAEKNVTGYRVYYVPGGSEKHKLICETATKTLTCVDTEPPKPTSPNLTYEIVALYHRAEGKPPALSSEVFEGTGASFTIEGGPPPAPATPPTLGAKKEADGSVKLTWTAPGGSPAVSFYRVYRGSSEYSGRYAEVPASATTFTDTNASTTHSYWVTAVSKTMTESQPVGPVTG
jgi:type II secretory pathway pseudopilin PulG